MTGPKRSGVHGRIRRKRALVIVAPLACAFVGACATTPRFDVPAGVAALDSIEEFNGERNTGQAPAGENALGWWRALGGEELDMLVEQLLAHNLSIAAAVERIRQARALERQSSGARLPVLTQTVEASSSDAPDFSGSTDRRESYLGSMAASWDTDIFGRLRTRNRAARLRADAAALAEIRLRQQLTAELASSYLSAYTLTRQIEVTQSRAQSFAETARLTELRYRAGSRNVDALDVQIARQNAAAAMTLIPSLEAQLDVQMQAIDVLLAEPPGQAQLRFDTATVSSALPPVSVGKPADVVSQLPDVKGAETEYRAALEDVGTARAEQRPSLTLSASLSLQTPEFGQLFDDADLVSSLAAGLLMPLYNAGQRRAEVSRIESVARELAHRYAESAILALADVERALRLESSSREEIELTHTSLAAARVSDRLASERYTAGRASLLSVLEARRALYAAQQELILAEQRQWDARISLHLALGGTWFERNR